MAVDTQQLLDAAEKLGKEIAQHAAIAKYRDAQLSLADDPEAARMMAEFDRQLLALSDQEQAGQPISESQRGKLEMLQTTLSSNLKVKALSIAQYDMSDLLRKISQAWQRPVAEAQAAGRAGATPAAAAAPSRLITPGL